MMLGLVGEGTRAGGFNPVVARAGAVPALVGGLREAVALGAVVVCLHAPILPPKKNNIVLHWTVTSCYTLSIGARRSDRREGTDGRPRIPYRTGQLDRSGNPSGAGAEAPQGQAQALMKRDPGETSTRVPTPSILRKEPHERTRNTHRHHRGGRIRDCCHRARVRDSARPWLTG